MNRAYADVSQLTGHDMMDLDADRLRVHRIRLRRLLENATIQIERHCNRVFYIREGTWYEDGSPSPLHLSRDLLSITTLKLDEDGDATYESTLAATDYHLYPLNAFPKTRIEVAHDGDYGGFAGGIKKGVEIVGSFGYGDGESASPWVDSRATVQDNPLTAAAVSLTASDGSKLAIGQMLRIESEQAYVEDIDHNTVTVVRGINGTTAAQHAQAVAISVYRYPAPVMEAALILALRAFNASRDTAWQDYRGGGASTGQLGVFQATHPIVAEMLAGYVRWSYL